MHGCRLAAPARVRRYVLGVLSVLLLVAPTSAAAAPTTGVNAGVWSSLDLPGLVSKLTGLRTAGAQEARVEVNWASIEPLPPVLGALHRYDFSGTDRMVEAAARAGLRPYVSMDYAPAWATTDGTMFASPKDDDGYVAAAAATVLRYGPVGTFWLEHPDVPRLPARRYEVWNEPNARMFWHDQQGSAERYAQLYAKTRAAIRTLDPLARVGTAGLVVNGSTAWFKRMWRSLPPSARTVDAVGLHPYDMDVAGNLGAVRRMRATLDELGLTSTPLWFSELGFFPQATGGARGRSGMLADLLNALQDPSLKVEVAMPYTGNEWDISPIVLRATRTASRGKKQRRSTRQQAASRRKASRSARTRR